MAVNVIETALKPIDKLKPHPENPNRGDVDSIADSLTSFGQYRPIVVNADDTILAGHHVWQAAKKVGWTDILVSVVDADEKDSRRILLADNRLAELGQGADIDLLLAALENMDPDDFMGTGFDDEYLTALQEAAQGPPSLEDLEHEAGEGQEDDYHTKIMMMLDPNVANLWTEHRKDHVNDTAALHALILSHQGADK
jgi:ParB-like chromosome segregation protein Spo0J